MTPTQKDSVTQSQEAPKARTRRHQGPAQMMDSLKKGSVKISRPERLQTTDDLSAVEIQIANSLDATNRKELERIEQPAPIVIKIDAVPPVQDLNERLFIPGPAKATWLAVVFPDGGQIYNRKHWKLSIIYEEFTECVYALSWNGKMYKDYSQVYLDIMDSNPNTKSYEDLLPPNTQYSEGQLKNTLKQRKDSFHRFRDLSMFAFIGVCLVPITDTYVSAGLSNFDISPDLSMKLGPTIIDNSSQFRSNSYKSKSARL